MVGEVLANLGLETDFFVQAHADSVPARCGLDLAGDGGGDQRGPAFLQEVDGALGFGGEGVELGSLGSEVLDDGDLLVSRWYCDGDLSVPSRI